MRRLVVSVIVSLLVTGLVHADELNNCGFLSLAISNNNPSACTLVRKELRHGNMSSGTLVPGLIPAGGTSYPFEIAQTFFGPDLILTYQCGEDREVTFESQQNMCLFVAGNITGMVHSAYNMSAAFASENGSYWWSSHGFISWTLYS